MLITNPEETTGVEALGRPFGARKPSRSTLKPLLSLIVLGLLDVIVYHACHSILGSKIVAHMPTQSRNRFFGNRYQQNCLLTQFTPRKKTVTISQVICWHVKWLYRQGQARQGRNGLIQMHFWNSQCLIAKQNKSELLWIHI